MLNKIEYRAFAKSLQLQGNFTQTIYEEVSAIYDEEFLSYDTVAILLNIETMAIFN